MELICTSVRRLVTAPAVWPASSRRVHRRVRKVIFSGDGELGNHTGRPFSSVGAWPTTSIRAYTRQRRAGGCRPPEPRHAHHSRGPRSAARSASRRFARASCRPSSAEKRGGRGGSAWTPPRWTSPFRAKSEAARRRERRSSRQSPPRLSRTTVAHDRTPAPTSIEIWLDIGTDLCRRKTADRAKSARRRQR